MYRLFMLFLLPLIAILSCNTTEPPSASGQISLSVEDVSCTEVWLRIKTTNISFPENITLFNNNQVTKVINLIGPDTLLYIDSLQNNKNYSFRASIGKDLAIITSGEIPVQTLDTTSNNISWQTFVFGTNKAQSIFDDVDIISENNIWVTGSLFQDDSLGNPDTDIYNLITWNGINWQAERVRYYDHSGQNSLAEIPSLFIFNENDIWLANYTHWNGSKFESVDLNIPLPYQIQRSWGTSFNNLYIVGNIGLIAIHSLNGWEKIESGTIEYIDDIWGVNDLIYCASKHEIIQIKENKSEITNLQPDWFIHSVWFKNSNKIYASGTGIFEKTNTTWKITNMGNNSIRLIRGTDYNNIFGISTEGFITHFNGSSWTNFTMPHGATYRSVSVKGKTVVCVGDNGLYGIITIGKME
jgi:hypothetical protein